MKKSEIAALDAVLLVEEHEVCVVEVAIREHERRGDIRGDLLWIERARAVKKELLRRLNNEKS
jgi:hypothetical protein